MLRENTVCCSTGAGQVRRILWQYGVVGEGPLYIKYIYTIVGIRDLDPIMLPTHEYWDIEFDTLNRKHTSVDNEIA